MRELHTVPDRPAPGPIAGGLLGVPAGLLLAWLWVDRDTAVALAVSLVLAGLVASVAAGAPTWRRFAIGMLSTAVVTTVVLVWLGVGAPSGGATSAVRRPCYEAWSAPSSSSSGSVMRWSSKTISMVSNPL